MKIVKCGNCGASFDVAAMKPGSQFACGKCRTPVSVPAEAPPATVMLSPDQMQKALDEARGGTAPGAASAAPKSQPKLPAAMQARAQAQASGSARAVGAADQSAPSVAAAVQTAPAKPPKRGPRPQAEAEGPKKSSAAMYASIVSGVAILGVVGYMALSGKSNDANKAETAKVTETKPAEVAKPVAKDPTNYDDFLTMPFAEQHDALVGRVAAAGTDLGKLKALHEWTNDAKVKGNGEVRAADARVIEVALAADKDCDWAHEARGDHKLADLLHAVNAECLEAFKRPDPGEKAVKERLTTIDTAPWADAKEWAKFQDIVAKIRARDERMKADPRYLMAEVKRNWVKENPVFKDVEITWIFADPYVIFQEVKKGDERDTKRVYNDKQGEWQEIPIDGTVNPSKQKQNEEWAKKGELFAKRDGIIFTELNRHFRELFALEYKLPELIDQKRMLTGLVMWNRTSFDKMLKEAGQPVTETIRAFYSPPQQKIFHYLGEESLQELDEVACEGGYVQKFADQVTAHEGTHQLQHEYSAISRGTPLKDSDTKVEDRKAMWFEEGIAEFMGACEVEEGKTEYLQDVHWRHNRILLERIQSSRPARDSATKWKIKDILKPNNNLDLDTIGKKLAENEPNMGVHFYSRAWAFCHFLWYYDNGKYRPKFLAYFKDVLAGIQSSEKFATKIMKRPNVNDWGPIEMEYEWYWDQLLSRKVGRDKVTHQWNHPETSAPTGKVEDDPDWISVWKEDHKK